MTIVVLAVDGSKYDTLARYNATRIGGHLTNPEVGTLKFSAHNTGYFRQ